MTDWLGVARGGNRLDALAALDAFQPVDPHDAVDAFDDSDYAIIGPVDNRVRETRTRRFPFNTICHLSRNFGDGRWRGCSGALIGPRHVLTAAHCLYDLRLRRGPHRVRVAPGRSDGHSAPFGLRLAAEGYVPRRFIDARSGRERSANDYGLLLLPRRFEGIERYLPLRVLTNEALSRFARAQRLLMIAGYPADRPEGTLWRHSERLRRFSPSLLQYSVDTCPGHSGSPVLAALAGEPVVVGVHTSGILDSEGRSYGCAPGALLAPSDRVNTGVRLTREVAENLQHPRRVIAGMTPMVRVL